MLNFDPNPQIKFEISLWILYFIVNPGIQYESQKSSGIRELNMNPDIQLASQSSICIQELNMNAEPNVNVKTNCDSENQIESNKFVWI